jgi:hypothetical protein
VPIWQDSTVLQEFTAGLDAINFSSMAEVFDPIHFTMWNDTLIFPSTMMTVSDTDAYSVDSISFSGALRRGSGNRPLSVVDTFIISIAVNSFPYLSEACNGSFFANNYINCMNYDTLKGFTIDSADVDSVERSLLASNGAIVWKIPIVDSMRHDTTVMDQFSFEVPGGLQVPAGYGFAVTVTFKSGDIWPVNVDTFSVYHNFMGVSGEGFGQQGPMPYYYYSHSDKGMSNLLFSTVPHAYYPVIFVEGWNSLYFKHEFHDISAHLGCNSCLTIAQRQAASVENRAKLQTRHSAYPVPASDEVNIVFTLGDDSKAIVSINNSLGQKVATQTAMSIPNVENKVVFNTSQMPAGVYFYTIEANGFSVSNKFTIFR